MVFTSNGNYATEQYVQDAILNSEDMKKLFVTKIPKDSTDEDLKSFFENICGGNVTEHVVIRKETAKNHFGFFTFETSRLVDEVIFREKELIFNDTTLEANRAVPKQHYQTGAHHKTKKLFIANLPKTGITEEELKQYFDERHDPKYGTIESLQLIKKKDEAGNPLEENKGFGFLTVSSEHLADTMSIQHATFEFNGQKIELKKSDRDRDGQSSRGGQRGGRGGHGGGQYGGGNYGGYGGYGGYGNGYDQWGYGYYDAYGMYPQYGVSSAVRGRGGKGAGASRGAARGAARGATRGATRGAARGAARGGRGKRYAPYAKNT